LQHLKDAKRRDVCVVRITAIVILKHQPSLNAVLNTAQLDRNDRSRRNMGLESVTFVYADLRKNKLVETNTFADQLDRMEANSPPK
jgi:hypothetical protein